MPFSQEVLEKIRLSVDISEIVRENVAGLKKFGRNYKALCPFHKEKTPSFMVSPEKGIFHCFGCHQGGDAFKFLMLIENISWPDAVRKLADRAGIVITESKTEMVQRSKKQKIYDTLDSAAKFYHRCLKESSEASVARQYLKERGVSDSSIEAFQLGFAPKGNLEDAASKKNYSTGDLILSGLVTKTDRGSIFEYMSGRLVFPIFDTHSRVVAFGGRTLGSDNPKYLNTPETPVYSKSNNLYGLFHGITDIKSKQEAILVEGYMDVIMAHQSGIKNAIAPLGTALTSNQIGLIKRYTDKISIIFDSDDAGHKAAARACELILDSELSLRVVILSGYKDPDEFIKKEGKESFENFIASNSLSALDYLTQKAIEKYGITSPETKVKCLMDLIPLLSRIKNAVLRYEWVKYISERLETSEDAVLSEWKRYKRLSSRYKDSEKIRDSELKADRKPRSLEEEILQLILNFNDLKNDVEEDIFKDERVLGIVKLVKKGVPSMEIVNHLSEGEVSWFTELVLEERNYSDPRRVFLDFIRDLQQNELKYRRMLLEKEVIPMMDGKIPKDEIKIKKYLELSSQLKGSIKS